MTFFSREWSDAEKWAMGIVSTLTITAVVALFSAGRGNVYLSIARAIEPTGRCVDRELFLENASESDVIDITISFDVDYFTRRGDIAINYGDEREQLITSAMNTLIERKPFLPILHSLDEKNSIIVIPRLKPGQYLHLFNIGDTLYNVESANKRNKLLESKLADLMDTPRVLDGSYKNGSIDINVVVEC